MSNLIVLCLSSHYQIIFFHEMEFLFMRKTMLALLRAPFSLGMYAPFTLHQL
jgi:hypothetical protein